MFNPNACCQWNDIPYACIECPIRKVEINCKLNTDYGDWKFWDRRKKKWPTGRQKIRNRGLLMELCRRSNCHPEYLKYLLDSEDYSSAECTCKYIEPFEKNNPAAAVPFTGDCTHCNFGDGFNNYGYGNFDQYYKNPYFIAKLKNFEKFDSNWLDKLGNLYDSYVGISEVDELEHLVAELQQKYLQFLYMSQFNNDEQNEENNHKENQKNSNKMEAGNRKLISCRYRFDTKEGTPFNRPQPFLTEYEQNYYRSRYNAIVS